MIAVFNIVIILSLTFVILDYKKGFVLVLCELFVVNPEVRLMLGGVSASILDVNSIGLLFSFFIHRGWKDAYLPNVLKKYFVLDILSIFLIILVSSHLVPVGYQIKLFIKEEIFHFISFCYVGYFALSGLRNYPIYVRFIFVIAILCGLYGIFSYVIGLNPYITLISMTYTDEESVASSFLDEERGSLIGRAYGTMVHPLAWGQFWCIILAFAMLCKKKVNKIILIPLFIIGIVNIYLCGSRSAMLSFGIAIFSFFLTLGIRKKIVVLFFVIMGLTIMSTIPNIRKSETMSYLLASVYFWDDSYSEEASIKGSSSEMRSDQLDVAIDVAINNPTGVGYGYLYYKTDHPRSDIVGLLGLESVFFRKIVELGFIGLLMYFYLMFLLYKFGLSVIKDKSSKILFFGFFWSYFICVLVTGIQARSEYYFVIFTIWYYIIESNRFKKSNKMVA